MKIRCIVFSVILLIISLLSAHANEKNYGSPEHSNLSPEDVFITSLPLGLKVYVTPYKADWKVNEFAKDQNFKGQTPLTLKLPKGKYLIGIERMHRFISQDQFKSPAEKLGLKNGDPIWYPDEKDFEYKKDSVTVHGLQFGEGQEAGQLIGMVLLKPYILEKKDTHPSRLISLNYFYNTPLDSLDILYPKNTNYKGNLDIIKKNLLDKGVSEKDLDKISSLLLRGGKIALVIKDRNILIIESSEKGEWDFRAKIIQ